MTRQTPDDVIGAEYINTRDLIEIRDDLREWLAEGEDNAADDIESAEAFVAAVAELESAGVEDFPYGATMIREDRFQDYARDFAEDVGAANRSSENQWPLYCIDWERAAHELAMDYSLVTFLGHDYYVR